MYYNYIVSRYKINKSQSTEYIFLKPCHLNQHNYENMIRSSQYCPELPFHRITSIKEHIKFLHSPSMKFAMKINNYKFF